MGVPASIFSRMLTTKAVVGGSLAVGVVALAGLAVVARRVRENSGRS